MLLLTPRGEAGCRTARQHDRHVRQEISNRSLPATAGQVLVLDCDDIRCAAACSMIEQRGYRVAGAVRAAALAPNVDAITPDTPALCVFDVSRPLTFPFIASEFAALKAVMRDRAPILLYGARPRRELHDLGTATGAV